MYKYEVIEAEPIVVAVLDAMLLWLPSRGRVGSEVRKICGDIKAKIQTYLYNDTLGPPLASAFTGARNAGMTLVQMDNVRAVAANLTAVSIGAVVVRDACIELALVEMSQIIVRTIFESKLDVDRVHDIIKAGFTPIEEEMCDQMDAMSYRMLITLHAAIIAHLVETAYPLPQMLRFWFARPWPTLTIAYKLYADAGRADQIRKENKVVHPAFELPYGRALSK